MDSITVKVSGRLSYTKIEGAAFFLFLKLKTKTETAVIRWGKHPPQWVVWIQVTIGCSHRVGWIQVTIGCPKRVGWIQVTIGSGKNAIPSD